MFSIDDPELVLPGRVALDTSFVVELLIETQPLHLTCERFMRQLIEYRAAVVTSELLDVELAEATFAIALKQRWGARWRSHRSDGRVRRPARRLLAEVATRFELLGSSADWISVPIGPVAADAAVLMTHHGLGSYDAVHAATAVAAGAEAIITTDTGFALLPSTLLPSYTDGSRLAACRAKRPR